MISVVGPVLYRVFALYCRPYRNAALNTIVPARVRFFALFAIGSFLMVGLDVDRQTQYTINDIVSWLLMVLFTAILVVRTIPVAAQFAKNQNARFTCLYSMLRGRRGTVRTTKLVQVKPISLAKHDNSARSNNAIDPTASSRASSRGSAAADGPTLFDVVHPAYGQPVALVGQRRGRTAAVATPPGVSAAMVVRSSAVAAAAPHGNGGVARALDILVVATY